MCEGLILCFSEHLKFITLLHVLKSLLAFVVHFQAYSFPVQSTFSEDAEQCLPKVVAEKSTLVMKVSLFIYKIIILTYLYNAKTNLLVVYTVALQLKALFLCTLRHNSVRYNFFHCIL